MKGNVSLLFGQFFFRCYLYGSPFTLVTDHQPLNFLMELDQFIGKLAKWVFILQEYNFNIVRKASKVNWDADGLSQNSSSNEEDTVNARWHGKVDLKVVPKRHAFTYLCTLLGCFRDVPQGNMSGGNSQSDGDEPKGNNALDIHLDLPIMAYLQEVRF